MTLEEFNLAVNYGWTIGDLRLLLHPIQRKMLQLWEDSKAFTTEFLFHVGRQTGKSFLLNVLAISYCLRTKNTKVVYVAPVEKKLADYVLPILNTILESCPEDIRPVYLSAKNQLSFKNGSVITYYGSNNENHSSIRGQGNIPLLILDECGFFDNLTELLAVVSPMLLRAGGNVIYSSSSPETPEHPFCVLIDKAVLGNWYFKAATWEDETVSKEALDDLAERLGGKDSTRYRREVGCELIVEKTRQALPEWDSNTMVKVIPRDANYQWLYHFVSFDPGFKDPASTTFGTYLFGQGKLYIEDEIVIPGREITPDAMAQKIKDKVKELWGNSDRVSYWADPENQTLLDIFANKHKIYFAWTAKDKKRQYLEQLRTFIKAGSLILDPKCVIHKRMFETTLWKKDWSEFERSASGFHGDCIDSTLYQYRNLNYSNPIPPIVNFNPQTQFIPASFNTMSEEQRDLLKWVGQDDEEVEHQEI